MKTREWLVGGPDQGTDLLAFVAARGALSRRKAKELLDSRHVLVNGRPVWMARHALRRGDTVTVPEAAPAPKGAGELRTAWEAGDLLVLDKPPGLLSNGPGSAEELLVARTGQPWRAVHRLDRDTSGCLLFARTAEAFESMVALFREKKILKLYHALAAGRLQGEGRIEEPLEGLPAETRYRVVSATERASHLVLRIDTGRTHQIRKHLALVKHPVLGDRSYGLAAVKDPALLAVDRQMLHASCIRFERPGSGERLRVETALPADFREAMRRLKLT